MSQATSFLRPKKSEGLDLVKSKAHSKARALNVPLRVCGQDSTPLFMSVFSPHLRASGQ